MELVLNELILKTIRYHNRTYYKCIDCGERASLNGGRCRKCRLVYNKANKKPRIKKHFPCKYNCGNTTTKKGSRCLRCYQRDAADKIKAEKYIARKYPCKKCGTLTIKENSLCKTCRDKILLEQGEKKQIENNKRKDANEKRLKSKFKKDTLQICPKSPDGHHIEIITDNIGKCKLCDRIKDYNKLLMPYLPNIGM